MTHNHRKIQTKPDEDGIRHSLRQSLHCAMRFEYCACVILPPTSLSHSEDWSCYPCPSREGRSIPRQVRLHWRTTISTQVLSVRHSRLVASRILESIAAAKMSRAVLFISVFAIFLDVLHAGQVRFLYVLKHEVLLVFCRPTKSKID